MPNDAAAPSPKADPKTMSARQQVFAELVQTEENFVNILRTIVDVFKTPLEEDPKMAQLLNQTQMKIIFGNVPPILEVHAKMLKEFQALLRDWKEPVVIGELRLWGTESGFLKKINNGLLSSCVGRI